MFDRQLADWNRDGWRYFETAEDCAANSTPEKVETYEGSTAGTRWQTAWTGPYRHSHETVITAEDAKAVALVYRCPIGDAGYADPIAELWG